MIERLFLSIAALYAGLTLLRCLLAMRYIRASRTGPNAQTVPMSEITILQPILGGDPALASCLEQNLRNAPTANFIWLLDEPDELGRVAAAEAIAATGRTDVILVIDSAPPATVNPKVYKLSRGAELTVTPYLAVLDDDTVLPPGTIERAATLASPDRLVTALPTYDSRATVWSRLVTGFVNGNAVVTYPPAALLGLSRTINGMFSVMRREDLVVRGGFAAIVHEVTDDYALAKLFLGQGGVIVQTCLCHPIVTTVNGVAHYSQLMRRWMVFATIYIRENLSATVLAVIVVPSMLPLPLLLLGIAAGPVHTALVLTLIAAKAWCTRRLAARLRPESAPISDILYEIAADLISPVHAIAATIGSNRIRWRSREMKLDGSRIANE